jgi:hypothetical protein
VYFEKQSTWGHSLSQDAVRDEIAFIRHAIEEGRGYVGKRSPDMLVWGIAIGVGYIATYAGVRGWFWLDQRWLWAACIVPPWLYSLRGTLRRLLPGHAAEPPPPAMRRAMQMLWLGCGISLTLLGVGLMVTGNTQCASFGAVSAGILGIAFFASSFLCNFAWMRWVAVGWWLGEIALLAQPRRPEILLLSAVLMLALLAFPGAILMRSRPVGT